MTEGGKGKGKGKDDGHDSGETSMREVEEGQGCPPPIPLKFWLDGFRAGRRRRVDK